MQLIQKQLTQVPRLKPVAAPEPLLTPVLAHGSQQHPAFVTQVPRFRNTAPRHASTQSRTGHVARATVEAEAPSALAVATRFLHFEETNDYSSLAQVVTADVKWRLRGLLQGNVTHRGIDAVRGALQSIHTQYQDLAYRINMASEEVDKVVLYWTASGVNRLPLHDQAASFRKSVFSGVSIMYLAPDGRVREVIEYRQPTREEMQAFFKADSSPAIKSLLDHGHVVPGEGSLPSTREATVDQSWRSRAVAAATEWVENWTPGPDLEQLVREDFEEFNRYSWPDFEQDVAGKAALEERCTRSARDAVAIVDTIADSYTNIIAVLWTDLQQVALADLGLQAQQQQQAAPSSSSSSSAAGASTSSAVSMSAASQALPDNALPRRQPAVDAEHGSVEKMKDGHLRVHLSHKTLSSVDEPSASLSAKGLYKFSGVTLFKVDSDCRIAWSVTFRELTMAEKQAYIKPEVLAAAAAAAIAARKKASSA